MYLNRITLIGFIGSDAERKASNATNIAIFSLATKTSWKNDAGSWESRTEWHRCVAFGKLADFAGTLSKGAHVAVEGELRSHEYQRELAVDTQKTTITQRVWEVRVDSVLKLDRAVKREASDETQEEVPRYRGISFHIPQAGINRAVSCRLGPYAASSQEYRWCSPPKRADEITVASEDGVCSVGLPLGVSLLRLS